MKRQVTKIRARWLALWTSISVVVGALVAGCGTGPSVRPTTVALAFQPVAASWTSASGWSITLTEASLSWEYVRFYESGEAYAVRRMRRSPQAMWQAVASWMTPWRVAHAHPGHFQDGAVKAELRYGKSLSLLGEQPVSLGTMQAFTGSYRAGELTFRATDRVVLKGTARKDKAEVPFATEIALVTQSLRGIETSHDVGKTPATATLRVEVAKWFALVDFSVFAQQGTSPATPDETSRNILRKAVLSTANYAFAWK